MWSVNDKTITITRGDTFICEFPAYLDGDDEPYELQEGDTVRFAVKKDYEDTDPCICKELDGYMLTLEPQDTKGLDFGVYRYDVQMTFADGVVSTYIAKARLIIDKEVH